MQILKYFKDNFKYIFSNKNFVLDDWDFNKEWTKNINNINNPRFIAISKIIKKNSAVIDLGCGNGDFLNYLKKTKNIVDVLGVEESLVGCKKCEEYNLKFIQSDLQNFNILEVKKFDYIVLSEVIEHIIDCEKLLLKLKNRYNKGLIITIPNSGYIWYRLRYLFGRFPIDENYPPNLHVRFWTQTDFEIWIQQLGFEILKIEGCGGFPQLWKIFPSLFSRNNLYYVK